MKGDDDHPNAVFPAIEELTYFVSKDWIRDIYDFCFGDRMFGFICSPARNCTDGYGLLRFMGEYKFNTIGSPLKINVKTMDEYSDAEQKTKFCACGSNATDCFQPSDAKLKSCVGVCGSVCKVSPNDKRTYSQDCYGANKGRAGDGARQVGEINPKWQPFMKFMASNLVPTDFKTLNILLGVIGALLFVGLLGGFVFSVRFGASRGDGDGDVPRHRLRSVTFFLSDD
ncbi:hypothetical protein PINS_up019238 [Pythium insidiosum]|nr:hypothetical protein PINS_up019238 [Pythium insidiosum]